MSVLDDLLGKKPQEITVTVCLDPDAGDAFARARREHQSAQRASDAKPDDVDLASVAVANQEKYDAALLELRGRVVRMTFRALDPGALDELKASHRPTDHQRTNARKNKENEPEWNVDTFPPVLIAASCIRIEGPSGTEAGLSIEDAERLWKSPNYNESERAEIFHTAVAAQVKATHVGDVPKD